MGKYAGNIKAQKYVPLGPGSWGLHHPLRIGHGSGIGQVELKHVSARLDVNAETQGISGLIQGIRAK